MPFRAGETYGPYEVASLLEEGRGGVVWRARNTRLGRDVAIRVLPASFASDPERRRQFEAEARLAGQLNHANVLTVLDLGEHDGAVCVVTELLEGETLGQLLARGKLPVRRAIEIAVQVGRGLGAAHVRGLVHRGLKPRSLFVTTEGQVKILDFGLALKPGETEEPGYAAPEQVRGAVVDARADIFSLGCILYEMLAGRRAFAGATAEETLAAIAQEEPPRLTEPPDSVPRPLAMLVERCMEKNPAERFQSARDLCFSLGQLSGRSASGRVEVGARALSGSVGGAVLASAAQASAVRRASAASASASTSSPSSSSSYSPGFLSAPVPGQGAASRSGSGSRTASAPASDMRPTRAFALAAGVCLGVVLVIEAWTGWARLRAKRAGPEAAAPSTAAPASLAPVRIVPFTFSGLDHAPTASPEGGRVAFVSTRDGTPRIWVSPPGEGKDVALTEGPDDVPRFSPDGASILFARRTAKGTAILRIPSGGGEPRRIVDDAFEADWSPDGTRVAFLRQAPAADHTHGVVGIARSDGSGENEVATFVDCVLAGVRWARDGKWIAVTRTPVGRGDPALLLVDPSTGKEEVLPSPGPRGLLTTATWANGSLVFGWTALSPAAPPGAPTLFVRRPPGRGPAAGIFWAEGVFEEGASRPPVVEWLGPDPDRFVFDSTQVRQGLSLVPLGGAGVESPSGPSPAPLTGGSGIDRQPVFSPDGRTVLFSSSRSGTFELWAADLSPPGPPRLARLTDRRSNDRDPAFSPDGREIAWSSDRGGTVEIWAADADGGRPRQVSKDGVEARSPTFTRDGRWIVYASGNPEKAGLWKVRPDGSEATRLLPGYWVLPEASPDGRTVLVVGTADGATPLRPGGQASIEFVDLPSGRRLPLRIDVPSRADRAASPGRPRWVRDGSAVCFLGEDGKGRTGIFRQDFRADGRETWRTRRAVAGFLPSLVTESFGLSPDGTRAVLSLRETTRRIQVAERVPAVPQARSAKAEKTGK